MGGSSVCRLLSRLGSGLCGLSACASGGAQASARSCSEGNGAHLGDLAQGGGVPRGSASKVAPPPSSSEASDMNAAVGDAQSKRGSSGETLHSLGGRLSRSLCCPPATGASAGAPQ
eukprot:6181553-Pleurochrysis_carterae.AAC.1